MLTGLTFLFLSCQDNGTIENFKHEKISIQHDHFEGENCASCHNPESSKKEKKKVEAKPDFISEDSLKLMLQ